MQGWTEKYEPQDMGTFAGLQGPRAVMTAFLGDPYPSAWLFLGGPGTGKTTMGLVLKKMLPAEMIHIASAECDIEKVGEIAHRCAYYPWQGKFWLILVDECDKMSSAAQTAFLSILDNTRMPKNAIFVFTANSTGSLLPRFLSRCRVLKFEAADVQTDIPDYLERVWTAEGNRQPIPSFKQIAEDASGNVRDALMRLEIEYLAAGTVFKRAESWGEGNRPVKAPAPVRTCKETKGTGKAKSTRFVMPGETLPAPWILKGTTKNGKSIYTLAAAA
jgi:replication-associated recombination protein RarA